MSVIVPSELTALTFSGLTQTHRTVGCTLHSGNGEENQQISFISMKSQNKDQAMITQEYIKERCKWKN